MSADLFESTIDSEKYGDLMLEMKVGGNLRIITIDPTKQGSIGTYICFTLPPNPDGWKETETLIGALQEWIRHTKEIFGNNHE